MSIRRTRTNPARRLLGVACCLWLATASAQAQDRPADGAFRRGIGISHAMAWAEIEPSPSRAFVFPPFASRDYALRPKELYALRRAGLDFVRLAVDPGPFLQFDGAQRDELDRILLARVNMVHAAGLAVVVEFHPSDLHQDYTAHALTRGVDTPLFRAYLQLLERTAALLGTLPSNAVALEVFNEPPVRAAAWQPMLEAAYRTIRRRAPNLLLVLDGAEEGSAEGMMRIDTRAFAADPAVLYTFHYYDPYQFTHQGASWNAARYLADVPYPALARPLKESLDATTASIEKADLPQPKRTFASMETRGQLETYRRSAFDRSTIARDFGRIAAWARDHKVPPGRILLGEFGARRSEHADAKQTAERARWFRDVREEAEAKGFGWAAWVYRGSGGFALTAADDRPDLEPAVIEALGLTDTLMPNRAGPRED